MAAPAKEEDPTARAQATLQQVAKLPLEHQRIWLRLVEQRYGWAVLLTMKPEDAQREQDRVAKILRQKTVGWNELAMLLRQLDQREKTAIGRLVRQYRWQVYETFHKQPRDMVDRQEAWYRIWSLWEKSGSPPEQQDRLMDWLADAIKARPRIRSARCRPIRSLATISPGTGATRQAIDAGRRLPSRGETGPAAPAKQAAEDPVRSGALQARWPLPLRVPDPRQAIGPAKQAGRVSRDPASGEHRVAAFRSRCRPRCAAVARLAGDCRGRSRELTRPALPHQPWS